MKNRSRMLALLTTALLGVAALAPGANVVAQETESLSYGPRPLYLIDRMADSELKDELMACRGQTPERTDFTIGHRGAPLMFPEHTTQGNRAAARMGAGILECDVTFTEDHELVCRHAQNDLHTTTDILASDLAETCQTPFTPASENGPATAECLSSDITLAEFRTLTGKMDAADTEATTVEGYMDGTADWRTDLYATEGGTLMTHAESIELFRSLGAKFTPELKSPAVEMPHNGFSQADYAQKLVDEYKAAGVPASDVWPQSFNLEDVRYWIENEPAFGEQAVYLDDSYNRDGFDPMDSATFEPSMQELADMGVNYIAPPMWMLVTTDGEEIVPSPYAKAATEAGIEIVAWTLERSGPLVDGGGWYFQTVEETIDTDADYYRMLDALHRKVGIAGMFSDWPATVTYYANCVGID